MTTTTAETVTLLRTAAADIRTRLGINGAPGSREYRLIHTVADLLDGAADREQEDVDEGLPLGEPQPGDGTYAAAQLARAWMEGR